MTIGGDLSPHGFPDWQPVRAVADIRLLDAIAQAVPTSYGPFFVGNFPSLGIRLSTSGGRVALTASFYQNKDGTGIIAVEGLAVALNSFFNGSIAVLGPYVVVATIDEAGIGPTADLNLSLHHWKGMTQQSDVANILVAVSNASIGAGATRNDQASQVWAGAAHLKYGTNATSSNINLQYLDSGGVWTTFWNKNSATQEDGAIVYLPPRPIRMQAINNDAASKGFSYYLVAEPHFAKG
jgi:hypothetical protein